MRLGNGTGSVYKLSGNRRKPWVARKTVGFNEKGHPQYKYLGYFRTKAEALECLMDYNKNPYSLNMETLQYVYERFYEGYSSTHTKKTVHGIDSTWNHLTPLHEFPIADITRRTLQEYFDGLQVTSIVKNKVKITLKMIFGYAIRYDILPPERITLFDYLDLSSDVAVKKNPRDRFTDDEIAKIKSMQDEMSRILMFLIYTGLRAGEFCNIQKGDISDDYVLNVKKSKTKAGIRQVPLSDKAIKLLPLPTITSYDTLNTKYAKWRKAHGISKNLHCTRYTTISLLVSAGIDDRIIKKIVGHKDKDVTQDVYTKITVDIMRDALNKI